MNARGKIHPLIPAGGIALLTFLVFLPTLWNDFINFDDPNYVTANYHVRKGLTAETISWAFTTDHAGNWHPLTWLSHALDCQLFGLKPAGHHLTNVLLHSASAALLFLLLLRATGATWRSAFVAAFFALHPLRAESVAWVAERKDVLSTFFFMLTLWAYVSYARQRSEPGSLAQSATAPIRSGKAQFVLALVCFTLGLLSKPMLVTVPFVLVLLDYWPLQRFPTDAKTSRFSGLRPLLIEKVPFLALAVAVSFVTFYVQRKGGNTSENLALPFRIANSLISYAAYCGKMIWPQAQAIIYPRPDTLPITRAALAAVILAVITAGVCWQLRKRRYLFVGWFWYVIMLAPVCGLIAIGAHALADRYTYLPGIGIALLLVWGVGDLFSARAGARKVAGGLGIAAVLGCALLTRHELGYWKNNRTLFERALQVTPRNEIALVNVAATRALAGNMTDALALCRQAIEVRPTFNDAWLQLGVLLAETGQPQEALQAVNRAIELEPKFAAEAYYTRGTLWLDLKQGANARTDFEAALRQNPDHLRARINLASLLDAAGDRDGAVREYTAVLRADPTDAVAHYNLASTLVRKGDIPAAITHYERSIELAPTNSGAYCNLGQMLLQQGQPDRARAQFESALRLDPRMAQAHFGLGQLLNQQGQTADALAHLKQALQPNPNFPAALNELAAIQATHPDAQYRNGAEAVRIAQQACQLTGNRNAVYLNTLAAAYAEAGNFGEAVKTAQQALELAQSAKQTAVAEHSTRLLELFRANQPSRATRP